MAEMGGAGFEPATCCRGNHEAIAAGRFPSGRRERSRLDVRLREAPVLCRARRESWESTAKRTAAGAAMANSEARSSFFTGDKVESSELCREATYEHYCIQDTLRAMAKPSEYSPATRPLPFEEAAQLAAAIGAFATGSRLLLLWAMLEGEHSVEELAGEAGLSQSATSHQLKVLRDARLVKLRRDGRHAFYSLHDHHVPDLLAALRRHYEHVEEEKAAEGGRADKAEAAV